MQPRSVTSISAALAALLVLAATALPVSVAAAAPAPASAAVTAAAGPSATGDGAVADEEAEGEGITWEKVLFIVFGGATVILALAVVLFRNPLSGAVALIFSFFALAGLYALAQAHFIAVIQVLVYAGAIMVLFIFVIMLLNLSDRELGVPRGKMVKGLALVTLATLALITWSGLRGLAGPEPMAAPAEVPDTFGTIRAVGTTLFNDWMLPFELTGVLLLVAVIGAVTLSRRGYRRLQQRRKAGGS